MEECSVQEWRADGGRRGAAYRQIDMQTNRCVD